MSDNGAGFQCWICPSCNDDHNYTEQECRAKAAAMPPSQQAKAAGLKSLLQVSETTGVSMQTLSNWHKNKPALFAVVIAGCVSIIEKQK